MKKIKYIFTLILIIASFNAFVQPRGFNKEQMEKIRSMKISYLTDVLELTPEEAQRFWPIYNEMERKRTDLMNKHVNLKRSTRENSENFTDKECKDILTQLSAFPREDAELREKYTEKFLTILSPQKVLKIYIAEDRFRHHLMKKYRGGGGEGKKGKHSSFEKSN